MDALNNYAGDGEINHLKLLGGTLVNLIIFPTAATLSLTQAAQWHKELSAIITKATLYHQRGRPAVFETKAINIKKSHTKQTFQRCLLSVFLPLKTERKASLFQVCGQNISSWVKMFHFSSFLYHVPHHLGAGTYARPVRVEILRRRSSEWLEGRQTSGRRRPAFSRSRRDS